MKKSKSFCSTKKNQDKSKCFNSIKENQLLTEFSIPPIPTNNIKVNGFEAKKGSVCTTFKWCGTCTWLFWVGLFLRGLLAPLV